MKASDIKKGYAVEHEGRAYIVRDLEKSSPTGRGGNTTYRFALYSIPGEQKLDLSLRADDQLKEIELNRRPATFSYKDGEAYVFMDVEDYTQYVLSAETVSDASGYITEGLEGCFVQLIDDQPVALQLPNSVILEVVDTPPELKGGSATKRSKPAKLTTGIEILVPEYVINGSRVLINTLTGEYAGRAD